MQYLRNLLPFILISMIVLVPQIVPAQVTGDTVLQNPASMVEQLYKEVTFAPGRTPNWDKVKSMFLPQSVVVLRTSREGSTVFTVEGFILDFIKFIENAKVRESGFEEKIIKMKSMVFGDISSILVLYEAHIPGSERPPQTGVDCFSMIKKDNRWWIASVINEIPAPDRPIPAELAD